MKAVLIATGESRDMNTLGRLYPTPLLPLIDRPFIQHIIEYLVSQRITEYDIILSHLPEKIESFLGDGTRWGCRFKYHLIRKPSLLFKTLKTLKEVRNNEQILLADTRTLPQVDVIGTRPSRDSSSPLLYCRLNKSYDFSEPRPIWTGWAWLPAQFIMGLEDIREKRDVNSYILSEAEKKGSIIEAPQSLSVHSYSNVLLSHRMVLDKRFTGLMLTGKEIQDRVWLCRNITLHPSAKIIPPVYIGQNCHIAKGVRIGPHAVIGKNCMLDSYSTITNAVVFPDTYAGQHLDLKDVIVDRHRMVNVRLESEVSIADDFILSNISDRQVRKWLSGLISRIFACALLTVIFPFFPIIFLYLKRKTGGNLICRKEVVKLPAPSDPSRWKRFHLLSLGRISKNDNNDPCSDTVIQSSYILPDILHDFFFRFIPGLINVARGDIKVVGVRPRSKADIMALNNDWKELYLKAKAGLVTEAFIYFGPNPTADELYSAEAFYSATMGKKHDLKLLLKYFFKVFNALHTIIYK